MARPSLAAFPYSEGIRTSSSAACKLFSQIHTSISYSFTGPNVALYFLYPGMGVFVGRALLQAVGDTIVAASAGRIG